MNPGHFVWVWVESHRCLNSAYKMRFGKPFLQILIPSRTPLHRSWWRTRKGSITPGDHRKNTVDALPGTLLLLVQQLGLMATGHADVSWTLPGFLVSLGMMQRTKWG